MSTLQQQMREVMIADGRSRYRLSKETGIAAETLSRFYHGDRGLSAAAMDKMAAVLGLELRPVKPGRKPKAKRKTPKRKGGK